MKPEFYTKGNVRVRTWAGPDPNIQLQTNLVTGGVVLITIDLPDKPRNATVPIRIGARTSQSTTFEELTVDGPAWLPQEQRELALRLIEEASKQTPTVWKNPSHEAAALADRMMAVLERVRASTVN